MSSSGKSERPRSFRQSMRENSHEFESIRPDQRVLTPDEKMFLLNVERGDLAYVKKIVAALGKKKNIFDINCTDPLGRNALVIAIENENLDLILFLLENDIELRLIMNDPLKYQREDSLLVAIREDYVDGVDTLLRFEEETHKPGTAYSWELVDQVTANFTSDITPLVLAAHRNNYEILKMLLDRGATIPMPHDVKCSCDECIEESERDSLRFSLSRINAYKALASPSLIALSSKDPIQTAFELSNELKRLSLMESQFKESYSTLRKQVQEFATDLIDHARTSYELEILLNHSPNGNSPWVPGEVQTLERLKLGIDYNQKHFVTHSSVQQLLGSIWYDGLPGFRRLHFLKQMLCVGKHAALYPAYSMAHIVAPNSTWGKFASKPFVKFITNSASYMIFLLLLALASQRAEHIVVDVLVYFFPHADWLAEIKASWVKHERGSLPTIIEMAVIVWVQALILKEIQAVLKEGLIEYLCDMWHLADIMSYGAFLNWIGLRAISWFVVKKEVWDGLHPENIWIPRDEWAPFDPFLLAEGMFGAGMISSFLKLIHIFSINPYLGPLQVSLGKMVIDIAKFLVLYILVLFSFGCGLNQLLWYYADLEKQKCYSLPGGLPDFENYGDSCVTWRRFANLWETSQSLFWASFGLVDLADFELEGIKAFTRFWGLLMFGSYSVCNIIVLLNMLIAMMSNSYTIISTRSDMEWKFARSKLWTSYFGEGDSVAPPFNLIPSPYDIFDKLCKKKSGEKDVEGEMKKANDRYFGVVRCLIRRYVTDIQRKSQDFNITEDDINEVRQDIRSFRYELINILKMNDMKTPQMKGESGVIGRKSKELERMIQRGFRITKIEGMVENMFSSLGASTETKPKSAAMFRKMARAVIKSDKKDWNEKVRQSSFKTDPIGSTETSIKRQQVSLKKSLLARGNSQEQIDISLKQLNADELVSYNPLLKDYTPATRLAYAKFKGRLSNIKEANDAEISESECKNTEKSPPKEERKILIADVEKPKIGGVPRSPVKGDVKADHPKTEVKVDEKIGAAEKNVIEKKAEEVSNKDIARNNFTEKKEIEEKGETVSTTKEIEKAEPKKDVTDAVDVKSRSEEIIKEPIDSEMDIDAILSRAMEQDMIEAKEDEEESDPGNLFDPKGVSVSTGRKITGWI